MHNLPLKPLIALIMAALWISGGIPGALAVENGGAEPPKRILYVFEEPTDAVSSFYSRLADKLPKENLVLLSTTITDLPADDDHALYIAAGSHALARLLEKNIKNPILAIFISRVAYHQVMRAYRIPDRGPAVSAVFSDPSPRHQLFLIKALFRGNTKTATILTEKTAFLKPALQQAAAQAAVPFSVVLHIENDELARTLAATLDSKVLLATPDDAVYNSETLKAVILTAYRRNQSIIGFSRQLVRAGGLATVYYRTDHILSRTADLLLRYLADNSLAAPGYPEEFSIDINDRVAESFGLTVPGADELKKSIDNMLEKAHEN